MVIVGLGLLGYLGVVSQTYMEVWCLSEASCLGVFLGIWLRLSLGCFSCFCFLAGLDVFGKLVFCLFGCVGFCVALWA